MNKFVYDSGGFMRPVLTRCHFRFVEINKNNVVKRLLSYVVIVICFSSVPAWADGQRAAQNLFANLANAGQSINNARVSNTFVAPSLIRGMYVVTDQRGDFVGFTNEAGTLFGDSRGFHGLRRGEKGFRPLNTKEAVDLQKEMVVNIDKEKLITVQYGNGQRRLFLFSAIDCPACKSLEDKLAKAGASENATFFVVPSSLQSNEAQWQRVSNIWCADDSATAWKKYWATGSTPAVSSCSFQEGHLAKKVRSYLWDMLKGAGLALHGTPTFVREDGLLLTTENLNLPLQTPKSFQWLVESNRSVITDYRPQPVGNQLINGTTNSNQVKTINVGEAVKWLIGK